MSKRKDETWAEYHKRRKEAGYNYFKQNQAKVQEKQRQKRASNDHADDKLYYARHKEEILKKMRADRYGLTIEELDALGNKCEVCESTERLCVDHDHFTGKVRGLLCNRCNAALGMLGDSEENIINLLNYLTRVNS